MQWEEVRDAIYRILTDFGGDESGSGGKGGTGVSPDQTESVGQLTVSQSKRLIAWRERWEGGRCNVRTLLGWRQESYSVLCAVCCVLCIDVISVLS